MLLYLPSLDISLLFFQTLNSLSVRCKNDQWSPIEPPASLLCFKTYFLFCVYYVSIDIFSLLLLNVQHIYNATNKCKSFACIFLSYTGVYAWYIENLLAISSWSHFLFNIWTLGITFHILILMTVSVEFIWWCIIFSLLHSTLNMLMTAVSAGLIIIWCPSSD